jgi:hypothetical protein
MPDDTRREWPMHEVIEWTEEDEAAPGPSAWCLADH